MCSQELRRLELQPARQPWLSTIIDEAHEMRNPFSFWAIGAMLAGVHSQRVVLLSGTPYNNNKGDLAAMCAFIDPSLPAARRQFWERALEKQSAAIVAQHHAWLSSYLLHRKKGVVLKDTLLGKQALTLPSYHPSPGQAGAHVT